MNMDNTKALIFAVGAYVLWMASKRMGSVQAPAASTASGVTTSPMGGAMGATEQQNNLGVIGS